MVDIHKFIGNHGRVRVLGMTDTDDTPFVGLTFHNVEQCLRPEEADEIAEKLHEAAMRARLKKSVNKSQSVGGDDAK